MRAFCLSCMDGYTTQASLNANLSCRAMIPIDSLETPALSSYYSGCICVDALQVHVKIHMLTGV